MLPRSRRLTSDRDFRAFGRGSQTRRGRYVHLKTKPTRATQSRFGFIVSRRVAKRATDRNTLKRRLRHISGKLPAQQPAQDILIIAQPGAAGQPTKQLQQELLSLLSTPRREKNHR